MYPDLSYLLEPLLGARYPMLGIAKTFGLFLALSFLVGGYILTLEFKRKEREGLIGGIEEFVMVGGSASTTELVGQFIYGLVLGSKFLWIILNFQEFAIDPAGSVFSLKGNLIGGILLGAFFAYFKYIDKEKQRAANILDVPIQQKITVMPHQRVGDFVIVAAISGIIGAKLFAVAEYMDQFWADPVGTLFSGSGLAFYGGLIGGAAASIWYARRMNFSIVHLMDSVAPVLITGYAVGRLGCHFSGDGDWGIPNLAPKPFSFLPDWLWAYSYPNNVLNEGVAIPGCVGEYCSVLPQAVYPTSVYEFIIGMGIFGILWLLRKRIKIHGLLFFIYLMFNGVERFFIEKIRVNPHYSFLGFNTSQAEVIATIIFFIGVVGFVYLWTTRRKAPLTLS